MTSIFCQAAQKFAWFLMSLISRDMTFFYTSLTLDSMEQTLSIANHSIYIDICKINFTIEKTHDPRFMRGKVGR